MEETEIVELINQMREANGLSKLHQNEFLQDAADSKTLEMKTNDYFAHISPDQQDIGSLVPGDYQYYAIGENLAYGFNNEAELIEVWAASPTHKNNILYENYQDTAVSVIPVGDSYLVAQVFGVEQTNYLAQVSQEKAVATSRTETTLTSIFTISLVITVGALLFLIVRRLQK